MIKGSVLFMCRDNSAMSQMAEAFAKQVAPKDIDVLSAGIEPAKSMEPAAVEVMKEYGIDMSSMQPKAVSDLGILQFDLVVALTGTADDTLPPVSGSPPVVRWVIREARALGEEHADKKETLKQAAGTIRSLVADLFRCGYCEAFLTYKINTDKVIDNIPLGILAHDKNRKIFFFSRGAEKLTGMSAGDVIGRDCHDVFVPRLCGDNCSFCDHDVIPLFEKKCYSTVIPEVRGERKELDVTVVPILDAKSRFQGVVASLADNTPLVSIMREYEGEDAFCGIIGRTNEMRSVFQQIRDLGVYDVPVNISGETGTGKELVARAIHKESTRRDGPFVPINCGALPEGLVESELFGHVKGSFSGAVRDKKGRFELADGGTLFLDEVAELPQSAQVKLLRFLQEGTLEKVGSETPISVNVRIISATNKDLKKEVEKGIFRSDLYYRLNVVPISLPPLRERKSDIPLLVNHFIKRMSAKSGINGITVSNEAMDHLVAYDWPGNVRELQNVLQFLVIKAAAGKTVKVAHLPPEIRGRDVTVAKPRGRRSKLVRETVENALARAGWNKAKAARILGVGRATLYRFLEKHPEIDAGGDDML